MTSNRWQWKGLLLFSVVLGLGGCSHKDEAQNDAKAIGDWVGTFVGDDGKKQAGANIHISPEHHWREVFRNLVVE